MFKLDVKLRLLQVSEAEDLARFLRDVANDKVIYTKLCGCGETIIFGVEQRPQEFEREAMEWALKLETLIEGTKGDG